MDVFSRDCKNLEFPYNICGQFDLNELDSAECKAEFWFEKHDIELLADKYWTSQIGLFVTRVQYAMGLKGCVSLWSDVHTLIVTLTWSIALEDLYQS